MGKVRFVASIVVKENICLENYVGDFVDAVDYTIYSDRIKVAIRTGLLNLWYEKYRNSTNDELTHNINRQLLIESALIPILLISDGYIERNSVNEYELSNILNNKLISSIRHNEPLYTFEVNPTLSPNFIGDEGLFVNPRSLKVRYGYLWFLNKISNTHNVELSNKLGVIVNEEKVMGYNQLGVSTYFI